MVLIVSISFVVRDVICNNVYIYILDLDLDIIIRTVVRIVGMGRMSHICNTKCSRL